MLPHEALDPGAESAESDEYGILPSRLGPVGQVKSRPGGILEGGEVAPPRAGMAIENLMKCHLERVQVATGQVARWHLSS